LIETNYMNEFKISFCVVCMNRLHQLKQTLPQNINDNHSYSRVEFIVLDYNSKDGMEEWVQKHMLDHIKSGLVTYYRTPDPVVFSHSHSKNMAFKLASGDIVCNINADHFIGKDFAYYVNELFNEDAKIVITPVDFFKTKPGYMLPTDVMGKVCVKKSDFNEITGFDESMGTYGFEDYDFINRLEFIGLKRSFIENHSFLQFIGHSNTERYSRDLITGNIYEFYVKYKTPSTTEILFLYKDGTVELGTLEDNSAINSQDYKYAFLERSDRYEFKRKEMDWKAGFWNEDGNDYHIFQKRFKKTQKDEYRLLISEDNTEIYYLINEIDIIDEIGKFKFFYLGRSVMERNLKNKIATVNRKFGEGIVYKNFNSENTIYI